MRIVSHSGKAGGRSRKPRSMESWKRGTDNRYTSCWLYHRLKKKSGKYHHDKQQSDGKEMELTGFWQKKYIPINAKGTDGTIANYSVFMYGRKADFQLDNTQDIVIIRFADVLLMNAELKERCLLYKSVRERSGLKPKSHFTRTRHYGTNDDGNSPLRGLTLS